MNVVKPLTCYVGIYLSSRDIFMSQEFLNRSEINSLVEQIRGETVAKSMGGGKHRNSRKLGVLLNDKLDGIRGKPQRIGARAF